MMTLKVFTPTGVTLDQPIHKVDFEGLDGFWTLLPHHMDFVDALKPCVVSYTDTNDKTRYIACNRGVVVKKGQTVFISTKLAIVDDDLNKLTKTIEIDFKQMEEERKEISTTMARLEIGLAKGLQALQKENGGPSGGL